MKMEELKNDNVALVKQCKMLEKKLKVVEGVMKEKLETAREDRKAIVYQLNRFKADELQRLTSMEKAMEEITSCCVEVNVEKLQKENMKLKKDYEERKAKVEELYPKLCSLQTYNEELQQEGHDLRKENKELKEQVSHGSTKDEIKEIYRVSMELKKENEKLTKDLQASRDYGKRCGEGLEQKAEEIAKLQKLVDEYKKCSLRENDATPEEITEYMEELSTELEAVQGDYEELVSWEKDVYDALDLDECNCSRKRCIEILEVVDSFYDPEMMGELAKEWANVWNCLHQEEENVYRQEGHDPEVDDQMLIEGFAYTSMRRITYMIELPCWNGKYRERLGDHIILGDKGAEEGGD